MGRGRKRKAEAPPPSFRVLRSERKNESSDKIDQSEPETRQLKSKPTRKAVRRNPPRDQNSDPNSAHPLLNTVIVNHLFEVWAPNLNALKTARLVCKTWFEETRPLWRSTAVLTLVPDDRVREEHTRQGMKISEFLNLHSSNLMKLKTIPFSRYCLKYWQMNNNECGASPRLWNILTPIAKYMRLKRCEFRLVSEFSLRHQSLLTMIFQKLPELQNLIVDRCQFFGGDLYYNQAKIFGFRTTDDIHKFLRVYRSNCPKSRHMNLANLTPPENHQNLRTLEVIGQIPFFWEPFLRLFPNLDTIRSRADITGDCDCLTTAIRTLRQENLASLNIQHLDLMSTLAFRLDAPGLERLSGCNLNLRSLCMEIGNWEPQIFDRVCREFISDNDARGLMKDMLEPQRDTLKVLKLFRISSCDHGPFKQFSFGDNITLDNLNEVHLYGPITDSFEFLRNVPNLRKLVINQKCEENWKHLPEFKISCTNTFEGDMIENTPTALFENLALAAPLDRLTSLHVDLGFPVKSLETLAKATPTLTTLQTILNNPRLITVGKKWRNLQDLKLLAGSHVTDDGIIKFCKLKPKPKLKKFVLQTYCGDESLGDRSVKTGFLKMKGLHTLQICVSRKMTRNGEVLLKKNIQEVVVHRNYGMENCPHGDYCRGKLNRRCGCSVILDDPPDSDFE